MASLRKRALPSGAIAWQVDYKDQYGHRRVKQFKTKGAADAFMVTARHEVKEGTHASISAEKMTVRDAAIAWLEHCETRKERGARMERASYEDYKGKTHNHILADDIGIGAIKLARLTTAEVEEFKERLLANGRSEVNTRKVLSVLYAVMKRAQLKKLISKNPVDGVEVERTSRVKPKIKAPTKESIRAMIAAASEDFKPLLVVSAMCGLRASEARGLTWDNVNFDAGVIEVRQRMDRYCVKGEPKSDAGHRDIPMGPFVINTLKRWKETCPKGEEGLVFPGPRGGIRNHANTLNRDFYPLFETLAKKHEEDPLKSPKVERFRWHDLRHFAVSLWIEQGFNIKAIQGFAGHSSIQMTMDRYGHMLPSDDHQKGMAEIESRMFG